MSYKIMIFDFDGTLRSFNKHAAYKGWLEILKHFKIEPPFKSDNEYFAWIKKGEYQRAQELGMSDADFKIAQQIFLNIWQKDNQVFDWVEQILPALANQAVIGIWSNAVLADIIKSLENVNHLMRFIFNPEKNFRKPDPAAINYLLAYWPQVKPAEIILIGDEKLDQKTALANGIDFAFVPWGRDNLSDFDQNQKIIVIEKPDDFLQLV